MSNQPTTKAEQNWLVGNGSKAICRGSNVLRSLLLNPRRSANHGNLNTENLHFAQQSVIESH